MQPVAAAFVGPGMSVRDDSGPSIWLWILAGGLFAAAASAPRVRTLAPENEHASATTATETLSSASARELRSLPGIGATRALAIAAARWRNGGRMSLEELDRIPGIGPETRAGIAEALRERGLDVGSAAHAHPTQ